jgi:hypothetical protein
MVMAMVAWPSRSLTTFGDADGQRGGGVAVADVV